MTQPVESESDVLAVYPAEYKDQDTAQARDAVVAAQTEMFLGYQADAQYAADQANVGRATGRYLDGLGEDRDLARSGNEKDGDYRARILGVPELVTPEAIIDVVNAILAPFTPIKAQYLESIQDRAYLRFRPVEDGPGPRGEDCAIVGATPNYPERLYPEDEAANGGARRQCSPGGAWLFGDRLGRYFILRVPDLSPLDTTIPALYYPSGSGVSATSKNRLFIRLGGANPSQNFLYNNSATALDVYGAICSAVTAIVGHSIRWKMISDPLLT